MIGKKEALKLARKYNWPVNEVVAFCNHFDDITAKLKRGKRDLSEIPIISYKDKKVGNEQMQEL